jgi:hypothetical protein
MLTLVHLDVQDTSKESTVLRSSNLIFDVSTHHEKNYPPIWLFFIPSQMVNISNDGQVVANKENYQELAVP